MHRAFSLVELSIVLVILGLLVGGVLSGQSLIHAAELRAVSTEEMRFSAAFNTFRDKYFALPGDMTNASSFWGAADGTTGNTAACSTTASSTTATCNGNGDGAVTAWTGSVEYFGSWKQLANAGLVEGSFTGAATGTNTNGILRGTNSPVSKLSSQANWGAYTDIAVITGNPIIFDGSQGNRISIVIVATSPALYGVMNASDAWNIDTKMDDGKPGTGSLKSSWGVTTSQSATACTNAASSADITTTYNLANANKDCALFFYKAF